MFAQVPLARLKQTQAVHEEWVRERLDAGRPSFGEAAARMVEGSEVGDMRHQQERRDWELARQIQDNDMPDLFETNGPRTSPYYEERQREAEEEDRTDADCAIVDEEDNDMFSPLWSREAAKVQAAAHRALAERTDTDGTHSYMSRVNRELSDLAAERARCEAAKSKARKDSFE
jgi:hypothetical protein